MRTDKIERITGWWLMIVSGVFAVAYWTTGFPGYWGSDDVLYAEYAASIIKNNFSVNSDLYSYRWGVLFPLAGSFALFGINDVAAAMPSLIATLLTAYIVWLSCDGLRFIFRAAAVCMFLLHDWTLYNAVMMMPDATVALAFMLTWFSLLRIRSDETKTLRYGLLFTSGLWLSVLTKESIIIYLPFFAIVFLIDWWRKRFRKFWSLVVLLNVVVTLLYLLTMYFVAGEFSARWNALVAGSYVNPCSYDVLPFENTLRRIGFELWRVWIQSGQLGILLLSLPLIALVSQHKNVASRERFVMLSAVACTLLANFTSISLKHYVPMCPDPRHFLYLSPLLAVSAGYGLQTFRPRGASHIMLTFSCIAVLILTLTIISADFSIWFWIALVIAFITAWWHRSTYGIISVCVIIVTGLLALNTFHYRYNRSLGYRHQKQVVKWLLQQNHKKAFVFTDEVQRRHGDFYSGFDTTNVRFARYHFYEQFANKANEIYVLDNPGTAWMNNQGTFLLPDSVRSNLIAVERRGNVTLYRIR